MGDNSISTVDPSTMVHDMINNFFGTEKNVIPFTAISCQIESKLMGLYICPDGEIWFVFLRTGKGMIRKSQSDVLGEGKALYKFQFLTDF
jgi:hypothetical protein